MRHVVPTRQRGRGGKGGGGERGGGDAATKLATTPVTWAPALSKKATRCPERGKAPPPRALSAPWWTGGARRRGSTARAHGATQRGSARPGSPQSEEGHATAATVAAAAATIAARGPPACRPPAPHPPARHRQSGRTAGWPPSANSTLTPPPRPPPTPQPIGIAMGGRRHGGECTRHRHARGGTGMPPHHPPAQGTPDTLTLPSTHLLSNVPCSLPHPNPITTPPYRWRFTSPRPWGRLVCRGCPKHHVLAR